jgi:uncharacterized protein (TIGR00725 family)
VKTARGLRIGVFGHGGERHIGKEAIAWTEAFGECVAGIGGTLYTGGGGGIMLAARRGCATHGGMVVSVNPEMDLDDESESLYRGSVVLTGQGKIGRVHLLTQSVDIGFAIGGGAGTLMEVTACYLLAKPVVVVDGFQGEDDPRIVNILNHVAPEAGPVPVQVGYLDGKDVSRVCPVRVCHKAIDPAQVLEVGVAALGSCQGRRHSVG